MCTFRAMIPSSVRENRKYWRISLRWFRREMRCFSLIAEWFTASKVCWRLLQYSDCIKENDGPQSIRTVYFWSISWKHRCSANHQRLDERTKHRTFLLFNMPAKPAGNNDRMKYLFLYVWNSDMIWYRIFGTQCSFRGFFPSFFYAHSSVAFVYSEHPA